MSDRGLTLGEIDMARGLFGDSIDYSKVRVTTRPWRVFGLLPMPIDVPHAPDGNVHYPGGYLPDYSASGVHLEQKAVFMHEMTQVWQKAMGKNVPMSAGANRKYNYRTVFQNVDFFMLVE